MTGWPPHPRHTEMACRRVAGEDDIPSGFLDTGSESAAMPRGTQYNAAGGFRNENWQRAAVRPGSAPPRANRDAASGHLLLRSTHGPLRQATDLNSKMLPICFHRAFNPTASS